MNQLRLLVIGTNESGSIDYLYYKHLKNLGVDVKLCTGQKMLYRYYNRSIFNKILFRIRLTMIYKKINKRILNIVKQHKPNAIWVFKGMELSPSLLKKLKKKEIKLINYNPDNPYIFSGRGSGNSNITNSIKLYDIHFTYNQEVKNRLEIETGKPVYILPFAFDESNTNAEYNTSIKEIKKVCFVGTPDKQRAKFIRELAKNDIPIDLYGNHWNRFIKHSKISIYPAVEAKELPLILSKYRIQLNLMRIHNINSHNMRSFEIPGSYGIQLAPYTEDHNTFFKDKYNIFLFNSVEECKNMAVELLSMEDKKALEIRLNSKITCIRYGHTYLNRTKNALSLIRKECQVQ